MNRSVGYKLSGCERIWVYWRMKKWIPQTWRTDFLKRCYLVTSKKLTMLGRNYVFLTKFERIRFGQNHRFYFGRLLTGISWQATGTVWSDRHCGFFCNHRSSGPSECWVIWFWYTVFSKNFSLCQFFAIFTINNSPSFSCSVKQITEEMNIIGRS